jgi:threonine synthase
LSKEDVKNLCGAGYAERAARIMELFLDEFTPGELESFAQKAYSSERFPSSSPAPVVKSGNDFYLELWHGPTCAFKDMALQMLPYLLSASLAKSGQDKNTLILTATSGDTGKAALEGFRDVERTKIMVFYPADGVSDIQALQMKTQKGDNVYVQAVEGNFDDTQTGVKAIFSDKKLRDAVEEAGWKFSSANSINWGRLLPQIVYYFSAYCDMVNNGELTAGDEINFCVPTGNFGNILSAYYAKKMGLPIKKLICASNANNVLTEFIRTGTYDRNREFYCTISPSMDILISSNLERLLFELSGKNDDAVRGFMSNLSIKGVYTVSDDMKKAIGELLWADFCSEDETKAAIERCWTVNGYLVDPHTAVALDVKQKYAASTGDNTAIVIVSTASPYKFGEAVLDAIGMTLGSDSENTEGIELIGILHEATGLPVPKQIAALKSAKVRFEGSITKEEMADCVLNFLK